MLGLGGRLTALRRLSSRGDDQSAASLFREKSGRAAVYLSVTRLFTFSTIFNLSRPQPDYINNQIISGFRSKTYSSQINKIKTALRTSCLTELSFMSAVA